MAQPRCRFCSWLDWLLCLAHPLRDGCPGQAGLQFSQIHREFQKLIFPAGDLAPLWCEFWDYATFRLETVFPLCKELHCSLCGSDGVGPSSDRKQTEVASPIVQLERTYAAGSSGGAGSGRFFR